MKIPNVNFTLLFQLFLSFYIRTRLTKRANLINIYNFFLDGYYKDNEFGNNGYAPNNFRKSNTMLLVTINTVVNTFLYYLLTSQEIDAPLTNSEGQAHIFFKLI